MFKTETMYSTYTVHSLFSTSPFVVKKSISTPPSFPSHHGVGGIGIDEACSGRQHCWEDGGNHKPLMEERNPVNSAVEVGSLSHYVPGFICLYIQFRWLGMGFLKHQQYVYLHEWLTLLGPLKAVNFESLSFLFPCGSICYFPRVLEGKQPVWLVYWLMIGISCATRLDLV